MAVFSTDSFSRTFQHLRSAFQHAFAVRTEPSEYSADDLALLIRMADAIVARGMTAPALLFLESMGPMNFLGSQALHFLTPILDCAFDTGDLDRIAALLERRDAGVRLAAAVEEASARRGAPAQ
jgi:hypothetical protein